MLRKNGQLQSGLPLRSLLYLREIPLTILNRCRVLSQCNTRLRLLYLLNISYSLILTLDFLTMVCRRHVNRFNDKALVSQFTFGQVIYRLRVGLYSEKLWPRA